MNNLLLTPKQAAEYLGVHLNTMYRLISTGEIAASRIGSRMIRIHREQLENYVKGQTNATRENE
jgi:excisionase family DNA binding protein